MNMIGESWVTTKFETLEDWATRNSFWPFPFGTACCAIEFMGTVSSHYDLARFGSEVVRFSPRQSDVLLVAGTINDKMAPVLKKIYDQMADPKWVISMGACACSGGFYRAYHVMQGIDEIIRRVRARGRAGRGRAGWSPNLRKTREFVELVTVGHKW